VTSDVIGRLTDKSLLVHGRAAGGSRWRMLETVHAYALDKLASSDEAVVIDALAPDIDLKPFFEGWIYSASLPRLKFHHEVTEGGVLVRFALAQYYASPFYASPPAAPASDASRSLRCIR